MVRGLTPATPVRDGYNLLARLVEHPCQTRRQYHPYVDLFRRENVALRMVRFTSGNVPLSRRRKLVARPLFVGDCV